MKAREDKTETGEKTERHGGRKEGLRKGEADDTKRER